jgi:hypothetical protein
MSHSHWHGGVADEEKSVLVSGSGDGGLIDVLSPILGTDVTRAAHILARALSDSPLREDIAKVEADRLLHAMPGKRDSNSACMFYDRVQLPPEAAARIQGSTDSRERLTERSVTLVFESTSAYSYTAAPINKLLVAHFSNAPKPFVKSVKGSLRQDGNSHRMECSNGECEGLDPPSKFDKVHRTTSTFLAHAAYNLKRVIAIIGVGPLMAAM